MINTSVFYGSFIAITIISSLLILTSTVPLSRLLLLIVVYMMSAFIFILLDFYFLGLTYIIVYVGDNFA